MPPLPVAALLETALSGLSRTSRAAVSALACYNGDPGSAADLAALVGVRSRYQLARALRRDGLPPLEQLAAWVRVLYWLLEAEASGVSLRRLARRAGLDPAAAYRLVRRVTGRCWSEVRRLGLPRTLQYLRARRRTPSLPLRFRAAASPVTLARVVGTPAGFTISAPEPHGTGVLRPMPTPGSIEERDTRHPAGRLTARLPIGGAPFDVAVTRHDVALVTCAHAASVLCLRLDPFEIVASIPVGSVPTRIVVDPSGCEAYVTNQFTQEIIVLDIVRGRSIGAIAVTGNPEGALLALDGRTLYVTTNIDRLYAIRLPQRRLVASAPIALTCSHLTLHPSGTRLYVATWKAGAILEFDASTLRSTRTFRVGGDVQDLAVSPDGLRLYAANERGWLDVIHLSTGRRDSLHLDAAAFGLALTPDGSQLYVGLISEGRVAVVDPVTLHILASINTGGTPRRIAFDRTGRVALIANEEGWIDLVH